MKLFFLLLLLLLPLPCHAEEVTPTWEVAEMQGIPNPENLTDGDWEDTQTVDDGAAVLIKSEAGISGLFLVLDLPYGEITLSDGTQAVTVDTGGILHDYIDVEQTLGITPQKLTLTFSSGEAAINEVCAFGPGPLPDWVEQWEKIPEGGADLLLFSTHGDDEQLFFAGLLPWYAGEQGMRVQVVYFTDHRNLTPHRVHEMLRGLWAVGVRDYPVFGAYPDYYTFDREDAYAFYEEAGYSRNDLLGFVTQCLRFYRPLVAVGHDEKGEYGHGMHQLTADLLEKALEASEDAARFPESASRYGTWQVPKTYLHLYPENSITMNWDIPLEAFGGRTAYQVSRDSGFACHKSQIADFAWYFEGADTAAQVMRYSPCQYGLYRSTVGNDTGIGDFFEHLTPRTATDVPPDPVPETLPETLPATQPESQTAPPASNQPTADPAITAARVWPVIPAVGTLTLAAFTAFYAADRKREKK